MTPNPEQYLDGFPDPETRLAFDPPPPTTEQWKRLSDAIAARVLPAKPAAKPRWKWRKASLWIGAGTAAGLLWGFFAIESRPKPVVRVQQALPTVEPRPDKRDPLEDFAVLPIATDEEIRIASLRGDWDRGLVVGSHLLPGDLPIATVDEVVVSRAPVGMQSPSETGDEPMVLSIKARRTGE